MSHFRCAFVLRYSSALYSSVLYDTVVYCTALRCTVLYCTLLYCTVLNCTALHCTALCCTVLWCAVLYRSLQYSTVQCCTVLYCADLNCAQQYILPNPALFSSAACFQGPFPSAASTIILAEVGRWPPPCSSCACLLPLRCGLLGGSVLMSRAWGLATVPTAPDGLGGDLLLADFSSAAVPLQALVASRAWCFRHVPFISWGCHMATLMLVSRLLGHRRVHLICWAEAYLQQVPLLMRALAGKHPEAPTSPPPPHASTPTPGPTPGFTAAPLGSPRACLEELRLTVIDPYQLVTKRVDLHSAKLLGATEAAFQGEAAALGLRLEFQVLFLEAQTLEAVLDPVRPRQGEIAAACCIYLMQRSSEDPRVGGGAQNTRHAGQTSKSGMPLISFLQTGAGSVQILFLCLCFSASPRGLGLQL